MSERPSIVVTGVGLTTSLGVGARATWQALLRGESAFGTGRGDEGRAPALEDEPSGPHERAIAHAVHAGREALADAGLDVFSPKPDARGRRGAIGSSSGEPQARGSGDVDASSGGPKDRGAGDVDPSPGEPEARDDLALVLGTSLAASAASPEFWRSVAASGLAGADWARLKTAIPEPLLDAVARALGIRGETLLVSNACAAGASAVALAADLVALGRARAAVALGFDALDVYTLAGFGALKALASGAPRPFALGRDGTRLACGFAALVLERESDARARGARALVRLLGVGESADAHHLTHPEPEGQGAALAMARALADAGLTPEQVDHVHAHATATPANDSAELLALERVFGARLPAVAISASKAALGHALGGAGGLAAALTVLAIRNQRLPSYAKKQDGLEPGAAKLDLVPEARAARIGVALSNSFGFGGCNASLVFGRVSE